MGDAVASYHKQQWLACLDQSRTLIVFYPDLPESSGARQLEQAIGTDRLERLSKELLENLGQVYWELAQDKLRQNEISQATSFMEKIVQSCPGTRYFPAAQDIFAMPTARRATCRPSICDVDRMPLAA